MFGLVGSFFKNPFLSIDDQKHLLKRPKVVPVIRKFFSYFEAGFCSINLNKNFDRAFLKMSQI